MGPRFLQSKIHSDYSTGSANWSEYRDQIKALYDASVSKMDFNDHLIREYNRKIDRLNQEAGLYITPFDGGFRFIGTSISSLFPEAALDFNFAEDRTIVPRVGPTPTFTRASTARYFGPNSINVQFVFDGSSYNANTSQMTLSSVLNGRYRWEEGDTAFLYNGTAWTLSQDGNTVTTSAPTTAWRPDDADWSGTGATVTTGNTFGIVGAAIDEPRFEYDPVTFECLGLLMEYSSVNRIFPSDTLTTQTRTTTFTLHTLSFYGTGTVVLSGTHSATVVGTSATTRTTYTFTPTFGNLTLTVTGSVTSAQLERFNKASSYIRTTSGIVTRSADLLQYADISDFYNEIAGTIFGQSILNNEGVLDYFAYFGINQNSISMSQSLASNFALRGDIVNNEDISFANAIGTISPGISTKIAFAFEDEASAVICLNGTLGTQDNTITMPLDANGGVSPTQLVLFADQLVIVNSFRYYPSRLSNEELQTLTTL